MPRPTDYSEPVIDTSPLIDESLPPQVDRNHKTRAGRLLPDVGSDIKNVVSESFALVRSADPSVVPLRVVVAIGQVLQYGAFGWLTANVVSTIRDSNLFDPQIVVPLIAAFGIKAGLEHTQRHLENTQALHQLKIENYIQAHLRSIAPKSLERLNQPSIAQDYRVVNGGGIWAFASANSTLIQGIGTAGSMAIAIVISSIYAPPLVTLALGVNAAYQTFKTVALMKLSVHHEEELSVKRSKAAQLGWQRIWPTFSQLFRGLGITEIIDQKVAERREVIVATENEFARKKGLYDSVGTAMTSLTAGFSFFALLNAMKSPTNPLSAENAVFVGLTMVPIFLSSLEQIGKALVEMVKAKPTLDAIRRLAASRAQEEGRQLNTIDWSSTTGAPVVVSDLHFAYPTANPEGRPVPIISGLSVTIEAGDFVAIVGDNGAGKSTLIQILTRSYSPLSGSVQIHGQDIRDVADASLFSGVKFLPQNVMQVDGYTIRDFLNWGRQAVGLEEDRALLETILDKVGVADILSTTVMTPDGRQVKEFPNGLDTILGAQDGGANFSGGQLSLLYIAYMLYSNAQILCFDEPEKAIADKRRDEFFNTLANIKDLLGYKPTIILVTHQMKSVPLADKVLFMNKGNGTPSDYGKHDDLLANNSAYKDLFASLSSPPTSSTQDQTT